MVQRRTRQREPTPAVSGCNVVDAFPDRRVSGISGSSGIRSGSDHARHVLVLSTLDILITPSLNDDEAMSQLHTHLETHPRREDPRPAKVYVLIVGAAAAALCAAALGWLVFLFVMDIYRIAPSEAARTAVTLLGVPTAAGAVFVALRSLRLKERQLHTDQLRLADASATFDLAFESEHNRREVEKEREFRSRYVSAANQMGSESAAVRLAGVNAMAQLADDWADQRQACVDVLCAYLRLPQMRDPAGKLDVADGEVRRTVQRLIAQGFKKLPGTEGASGWPDVDLNLQGAILVDFHMSRLAVRKAVFADVQFQGTTSFYGSTFQAAFFSGARFARRANFRECEFYRVSFSAAIFAGAAEFRGATFTGTASFVQTRFRSELELSGVESTVPILFQQAAFRKHPTYSEEGYKLRIQSCRIGVWPISDVEA